MGLLSCKTDMDVADYVKGNKLLTPRPCGKGERRGDWDRTSDLLFPKQFIPYLAPINIVSD